MKLDFKFGKKESAALKKPVIPALAVFWQKSYKTVLLLILVGVIFAGSYIWRSSLSGGQWSAERKQEYLDSQNKGVTFKENDFKKAMVDVQLRKQDMVNDQQPMNEIFKAY